MSDASSEAGSADAVGSGVLDLVLTGPGSDFSEEPVWGSEPATLESVSFPRCPPGPVPRCSIRSLSILLEDDVGEPAFDAAHRCHRGFDVGFLAVVVVAALARVPELDAGHDVQHPVDLPVPLFGRAGGGPGRRRRRRWARCRSRRRSGPCSGTG